MTFSSMSLFCSVISVIVFRFHFSFAVFGLSGLSVS